MIENVLNAVISTDKTSTFGDIHFSKAVQLPFKIAEKDCFSVGESPFWHIFLMVSTCTFNLTKNVMEVYFENIDPEADNLSIQDMEDLFIKEGWAKHDS